MILGDARRFGTAAASPSSRSQQTALNASNPPDANTSTGVNWTKSPSGGNGGGGDDGGKSTNVLMVALSWLQMEA